MGYNKLRIKNQTKIKQIKSTNNQEKGDSKNDKESRSNLQ